MAPVITAVPIPNATYLQEGNSSHQSIGALASTFIFIRNNPRSHSRVRKPQAKIALVDSQLRCDKTSVCNAYLLATDRQWSIILENIRPCHSRPPQGNSASGSQSPRGLPATSPARRQTFRATSLPSNGRKRHGDGEPLLWQPMIVFD